MRYAILADIHSNLTAFEAVLEDMDRRGKADELWCVGDIVGYGPDPHQCLELLRQHNHLCVAGNHDWAAIGKVDISLFNPVAAAACHWTARQLNPDEVHYLANLPQVFQRDDFTIVHGSPREPVWEYLLSSDDARGNLNYFPSRFCLVGHSHVPLLFEYLAESDVCLSERLPPEVLLGVRKGRLIINPGGVGQPRDSDPRASYAIYDSEDRAIYHYRVPYDIAATQERMEKCGLPRPLAARLSYGW
jgi:predicted phosphodiesterase